MTNNHQNEKGAIMIEILAVLALIGVMGPMLYRQVLSRNEEISNVNIATEMRTIKEAVSSLIAADAAVLGQECNPTSSDPKVCNIANLRSRIEPFLPVGMSSSESAILDYYDVKLYGYQVDFGTGGTSDVRPYVYGVVSSVPDGLPERWNFKRAARVASLIGSDGGVSNGNSYSGTSGSWILPADGSVPENSVIATTAFDSFEPDFGVTAPNAVSAPDDLAFRRLHAWEYFSVGDKGKNLQGRCFDQVRTSPEVGDTIYNVGGLNNCDPLFWVGASAEGADKSVSGQVYVKNNIYIGRDNAKDRSAVAIETNTTEDTGTNKETVNEERRIVVYDIDGNDKVTIDGRGRIIAKGPNETLTIEDGKIMSDKTTAIADTGKTSQYGVDPAYTSVMNDIRLTSRGGARLSDVLPNYIAKNMQTISSSATSNPYSTTVSKPTCPKGYAAAIVVTPLKWGGTNIDNITVPGQTLTAGAGHSLSANITSGAVTGQINVGQKTMKDASNPITVTKTKEGLSVEITGGSGAGNKIPANNAVSSWTVRAGYKKPGSGSFENLTLTSGEIQLLAQTYCVFDGAVTKPAERLEVTNP